MGCPELRNRVTEIAQGAIGEQARRLSAANRWACADADKMDGVRSNRERVVWVRIHSR